MPAHGRGKKDALPYGEGLIVNVPLPEPEVAEVVEEVAHNTIIRGTKEYNKDEYIAGAVALASTPVFPEWKEGGKVFYKVRLQALDPRNFKDGGDVGTLAVRYVVKPQGDKNTVLRIDALFVEDFRRVVHLSSGSVEGAEYRDIQDHLQAVELVKRETEEALQAKQERLAKQNSPAGNSDDNSVPVTSSSTTNSPDRTNDQTSPKHSPGENSSNVATVSAMQSSPAPPPASSSMAQPPAVYEDSSESLEQHVAGLRKQVERLVKKPGAPLQSAPFHTATKLKSLDPGTEVLIQIATPYWYGVETRDGQHGWIRRDQLEQVP